MSVVLGSGVHRYEVEEGWLKLPEGMALGDVAAVGVDRADRVYLFNRGPNPMIVVDARGEFVDTWGHDIFSRPHGIHIAPDDCIYCTDDGDHSVRKCTLDGRVLMQIGVPGAPAPAMSGLPFNRCTHTALSPEGDIYVSDGYGNARIHKYSADGRLLFSWGEPGSGPGQFNFPHNICCDADGWVYVADRENHRIQIFDGNGRFETQIVNIHRPSALAISPGSCPICYIGELGPYLPVNRGWPNLGPRVSVLTHRGDLLAQLGRAPAAGTEPGQFLSPHGIALSSNGDIYVGEVAERGWESLFPGKAPPPDLPRFHKLKKIAPETVGS